MSDRWGRLVILAVLGAMGWSASLSAQDGGPRVRITAHIEDIDDRRPLAGAVIRLSGLEDRWVTTAGGVVEMDVPMGTYTLNVRRPGYQTVVGDFEVIRTGEFTLRLTAEELDDPDSPGRVLGTVLDHETGRPIEGVSVALPGGGNMLSDHRGRFLFPSVPASDADISFERLGYTDRTEAVVVLPGQTTAVEVRMAVAAIELPPIEVQVRSRFLEMHGVYDRLERGTTSHFLTREAIEMRPSERLSDSFWDMPGVHVSRENKRSILYGRGNCPLRVYLDGVEMGLEVDGRVDIDLVSPEWVEVAEVYTGLSATPVQYSRGLGDCGVVLIWTRQPGRRSG